MCSMCSPRVSEKMTISSIDYDELIQSVLQYTVHHPLEDAGALHSPKGMTTHS